MAREATNDERRAFWRTGSERCVQCQAAVVETREPDGARMNGDSWGVDRFACPACGWFTTFKYDEANVPERWELEDWELERRAEADAARELDKHTGRPRR